MRGRPVRLIGCWITADLLSILGTRLAALAVPWLVLTTTGSATKTGLVAAAELLPMVIARALSGPLLDRFGAVRSAVIADLVSATAVIAVPLLWTNDLLSFPALMILVAVVGAARGPSDSAKQIMLPTLATATGQPLERVTGLGGTTERLATTIGLAVGGVVVAAVGGADALVVTAAGFAASAVLTVTVLRPALAGHQPTPSRRESYAREFADGVRGLRSDPVLVGIVIMIAITNGIDQAFSAVLLPDWIVRHGYGAETLGLLYAAFMAAAVAGSLVATALSRRLPRLAVYFVAFLLAGAPRYLAMALDAPLAAVVAVLAIGGFGAGFVNPILSAVTLERAPVALRGRVLALIGAASVALMPIGSLLGGLLADRSGLTLTLVLAGVIYLAVTMMPIVVPSWRGFGRRPEPEATSEGPTADPEQGDTGKHGAQRKVPVRTS